MSVSPARLAALEVVGRVRARGAYAHETLDAVLRERSLSEADSALATRLGYGVVQCLGTLDEALSRYVRRPDTTDPEVMDVLRMAAYELLFARTPQRAVVHQAVEAARIVSPRSAGFANAVLRRLAEDARDFPWGNPDEDDAALARAFAHPEWLVRLLVSEHGRQTTLEMLRANSSPAPLYLAHNPFRGSREEAEALLAEDAAGIAPGPLDGCWSASSPSNAVRGRAVAEGYALVTDAAAQIAPRVFGPRPGQRLLDAAAGRGTKTALLAAASHGVDSPTIWAVDIHAFKTRVLARRMEELLIPNVVAATGDMTRPASIDGLAEGIPFAAVLVDAPCSGLGALRRRPELRWRVEPETPARLARLGQAMLAAAASLVRPGGFVVYSTCTVTRAENQDVIERFLSGDVGREFSRTPVGDRVPSGMRAFMVDGDFQSLPTLGGPDGHFVAALVRATT